MDVIEMITKRLKQLVLQKKEAKDKKEILDQYLENDEEYISLKESAKEANKRLSMHRQALFNEPENRKILTDLKDINKDIKDLKAILSGELLTVYIDRNKLEFVDNEGKMRKISIRAEVKNTNQPSLF